MRSLPTVVFTAFLEAVLVGGCLHGTQSPQGPCPVETPGLSPPSSASDTLSLEGASYVLDPYLWRDFMPMSPPDGRPMNAVVRLTRCDSTAVADSLALDHLWVVASDATWSTGFLEDGQMGLPPYQIGRVASCGPKWDPGSIVDVIARVRLGSSGVSYVGRRQVPIDETM
jgi:hypothetical protein